MSVSIFNPCSDVHITSIAQPTLYVQVFLRRLYLCWFQNWCRMSSRTDVECLPELT